MDKDTYIIYYNIYYYLVFSKVNATTMKYDIGKGSYGLLRNDVENAMIKESDEVR